MGTETAERTGSKPKAPSSAVASVLSHKRRGQILVRLRGRAKSPAELARELDAPLHEVIYHTNKLEEIGAIELVRECQAKGTGVKEHFYTSLSGLSVTAEEYEQLGPTQRAAFDIKVLQHFAADAGSALDAGTLIARHDHHMSRVPSVVDDQAWAEMVELYVEMERREFEIIAAATKRMAESGEAGSPISSIKAFFELPEESPNLLPNGYPVE